MNILRRAMAWLGAEPVQNLPTYPCIIAMPSREAQLASEIDRLRHYRDTYGISFQQTLAIWREGLSVDEVVARVKQNAERSR